MIFILLIVFVILTLVAVGFAVWPLLRDRAMRGRFLLAAALAALVLGLGVGAYVMLGTPSLALRSLTGPSNTDIRGLVATLAQRVVRQSPNDPRGWTLLGRGYLTLNDPADAAAAFKRALFVAQPAQRAPLLSAYGEALSSASGGVTPEAQAAFEDALKLDPHDAASLFYLGQAAAQRGDRNRALQYWTTLQADTPASAPLHAMLVDRIAALTSQSGGGAPDISAMVEGLAARLKANPNDAQGWLRLVRAYSVLGEKDKARAALSDARTALKSDSASLKALDEEMRTDGL